VVDGYNLTLIHDTQMTRQKLIGGSRKSLTRRYIKAKVVIKGKTGNLDIQAQTRYNSKLSENNLM
jgi:hypothetical protein